MRWAITLLVLRLAAPAAGAEVDEVTIAGEPVADPMRFASLLDELPVADPVPAVAAVVEIVVRRDRPRSTERMEYFPLEEVLRRDGRWLETSDDLADRIEEELEARAAEGQSDWPAYASLAALLAAGGALVWLRWGRRRWRAREP